MLLDMYYKYPAWLAMCDASSTSTFPQLTVPPFKAANGKEYTQITEFGFSSSVTSSYYYLFERSVRGRPYKGMLSQSAEPEKKCPDMPSNIVVGTGTTPPTASDYMIESELVSELSCNDVSAFYDMDKGTVTFKKTMTNISGRELTISEIGLTCSGAKTYNSDYFQILIYREVLATPIVVADGESFTVSVTHQYPMSA